MPISHLITHHITAQAGAETTLKLSDKTAEIVEQSERLIDALKGSFFSRLTREHGSFSEDDVPSPLASGLTEYATQKSDFVALTTQLMTQLKTTLDEADQGLKADVIFFTEQHADNHVFYMLLASQKTAFTITPSLAMASTSYLDLGPTLFGIKVDIAEWRTQKHYAYLSLVPPQGGRKLTDVFQRLTGFIPGLDKADSTDAFLSGVEAFAQEVPQDARNDYRSQVVDYCAEQEQRDEPIDLQALSRVMEGVDSDKFTRFMSDYTPEGDNALMMDRRSLRRYVKFTGRERDLAISFSASQLNSRVHYNPDKDTLSIDGIPRALRDQLLRHLNK